MTDDTQAEQTEPASYAMAIAGELDELAKPVSQGGRAVWELRWKLDRTIALAVQAIVDDLEQRIVEGLRTGRVTVLPPTNAEAIAGLRAERDEAELRARRAVQRAERAEAQRDEVLDFARAVFDVGQRMFSPIWASAEQLLRRQGPPPEGAVQPAGTTLPPKLATTAPQDAEPADPPTATTEAADAAVCSTCDGQGDIPCAAHVAGDPCIDGWLSCPDCSGTGAPPMAPPW